MQTKTGLFIILSLLLVFLITNVKQSEDTATKPPTKVISLQIVPLPPPPPKVVIVKLTDEISRSWSIPLETAFKDSTCKVVIAWIESGGGGATETQILSHRIELLKEKYKKPFIVYTEEWNMSGAYWTSCEADKIIISPVAMIGSIGVYIQRLDRTAADSMQGVIYYTFRSGDLKDMGDDHIPMTLTEALFWEQMIQRCYRDFLNQVLTHRFASLSSAYTLNYNAVADSNAVAQELIKIANGQPYFADRALALGLVDGIQWLDEIEKVYLDQKFVIDTIGDE